MFKRLLLQSLFWVIPLLAVAQPREITGIVKDLNTGQPLIGANVVIKGTQRGTITNASGEFIFSASPGDILLFSYIGYVNQEILLEDQTFLEVLLSEDTQALEEVVIIGYGTVRKSDLTGSVSSLKSEDITRVTSLNPEQSLQGKVTGVHVTSSSGAPGAASVVRIRGVGTFNNSAPIYVVDGVILNDISFLNSADISSMEILKDASATAIFGSRGANGVILITTKSGDKGAEAISFSYSGEVGLQQVEKKIDLLDGREFAIISNEIVPGSYNNIDAVPNTDWQDLIFRVAPMQNHQFSASGGTKLSQYYVSVGYFDQKGIIEKSEYKRLTFRLNNTYQLSTNIKLGNNISIAPYRQQNAPDVTYAAYRAQPVLEPYLPDGSYAGVYNVGNPLASIEYFNNYANGLRGVGSIFAEASLFEHFTLKSSYGVDAQYSKYRSFTPAYQIFYPDGTPAQQENLYSDLNKGSGDNLGWLWENTLSFNRAFRKHAFDVVGGFTMQKISSEGFSLRGENILRDGEDFWYIQPAYIIDENNNINTLQSISNGVDANSYYSMMSYLFRTNYTFNDKYIFTVTYRRDGSSKFSKENRYSDFPSFAAGWNIGREAFMQEIPLVSRLKLRASWGIIGNEKIPYSDRYARVNSGLLAVFGNPDIAIPAASYGKNGNPDLKWESTQQTDIGLEVGVLDNKLSAEFDFYNRVTDDILVELSTPGHQGNGMGQRIRYNAASVLNRGFEFMFTWRETRGDFSYNLNLLGTTVKNEVLSIGGNSGVDSVLIGGYLANGQPVTQSEVGLPIGAFYGYKTDGLFQDQDDLNAYPHTSQAGPGDLRFVDTNNDNVINGQDRTFIGSPIPKFVFGISAGMEYRGFDFSMDFQGQTGNKIFNGKEVV
ncbi:MAG: TonB-dependent receptor, partial [Bacteroidales bacterium]|nr:TonB-dependent receptor [Bacteroidales bacterium]